ncbi:hypothetical protein [Legionella feeleii]|uniref:Uncharacterized protein n=1 Tax=Legionella feeleii TaxID=453 RepID=A0A0W0TUZ8_9GAMM|nr:hypothetical protein [Legionella feeleii]KTC99227.1 hypothetical protein Lfee_1393 [Legionella feeleii]SPX61082.1 Uncharacterised protein [Legionella feeleii]
MRFFQGADHKEITCNLEGTTAERYAWCLNQLHSQLKKALSPDQKRQSLREFKKNMEQQPDTGRLFNEIESQYYTFLDKNSQLPKDDYLFNCFATLNIDGGYFSCTQ